MIEIMAKSFHLYRSSYFWWTQIVPTCGARVPVYNIIDMSHIRTVWAEPFEDPILPNRFVLQNLMWVNPKSSAAKSLKKVSGVKKFRYFFSFFWKKNIRNFWAASKSFFFFYSGWLLQPEWAAPACKVGVVLGPLIVSSSLTLTPDGLFERDFLMPPIPKTFCCRAPIFFGDFLTPDFLAGPSQNLIYSSDSIEWTLLGDRLLKIVHCIAFSFIFKEFR